MTNVKLKSEKYVTHSRLISNTVLFIGSKYFLHSGTDWRCSIPSCVRQCNSEACISEVPALRGIDFRVAVMCRVRHRTGANNVTQYWYMQITAM